MVVREGRLPGLGFAAADAVRPPQDHAKVFKFDWLKDPKRKPPYLTS